MSEGDRLKKRRRKFIIRFYAAGLLIGCALFYVFYILLKVTSQ